MSHISLQNVSMQFKPNAVGLTLKERIARATYSSVLSQPITALDEINLEIKENDRVGIIGHNGAGKTTLLKIVSNIYKPTFGKADVSGHVAPLIEIGAGFHPELTGIENIFLYASIIGIPKKLVKSELQAIIDFSELGSAIERPVKYYSTGMALRLAFAINTQFTPDIIILDELFVGMDRAFIEKASVRLKAHIKQAKIFLIVAHNEEYIKEFCNQVVLMKQGKISFKGPVNEGIQKYHQEASA